MQFLHKIVVIAFQCLFDEVIGFLRIICRLKEDLALEKWEVPTILEMNVEETAGGKYQDVMEDYCAHAQS